MLLLYFWSWSQFIILYHVDRFKSQQPILKVHSPICGVTTHGYSFSQFLFHALIKMRISTLDVSAMSPFAGTIVFWLLLHRRIIIATDEKSILDYNQGRAIFKVFLNRFPKSKTPLKIELIQ